MSASDAAPLPRLGEVFFDVRGDSRSMRLSWYADTGVAVFSIWQGGVCTGTFRLPIDDLPRMVETLQRGPTGRARPTSADRYRDPGADPYAKTALVKQPAYPERQDYLTGGYPQQDDLGPGYQFDRPPSQDQFNDSTAGTDHGPERFVPPYVRGPGDAYPIDNIADEREYPGGYRQDAFRDDAQPSPSERQQYPDAAWSSAGYSEGPRFPIALDRPHDAYSGRPAGEKPGSADWPEDDEADLPGTGGNRAWQHDYRGHRAR